MDKQKRFKKQELKSEDYKGMERGAKVLKCCMGAAVSAALLVKNTKNLKPLGKSVLELAIRAIKM